MKDSFTGYRIICSDIDIATDIYLILALLIWHSSLHAYEVNIYHINAFLYVMSYFSLAALKILSLFLTFNGLLMIYLDVDCFVFFLTGAC